MNDYWWPARRAPKSQPANIDRRQIYGGAGKLKF